MSDIYGNDYYEYGVDGSFTAWITDYLAVIIWVSVLFLLIKDLNLNRDNWSILFKSDYLFNENDRRYSLLLYMSALTLLHLVGGIYHHAFPHNEDYPDTPIGYYIFHGLTIIMCGFVGIFLAFMTRVPSKCCTAISLRIWNILFIILNLIGVVYGLITLSVIVFAGIWLPLYICLWVSIIGKINNSCQQMHTIVHFWFISLYLVLAFGGAAVYINLTADSKCGSQDLSNCPLDVSKMSPLGLFHLVETIQAIVLYWAVKLEADHLNIYSQRYSNMN